MPLVNLPAWVVPNDVSVEREVAPYRGLPLSEKLRLVEVATRGALILCRSRPDGREPWELPPDPLPGSTIEALRRLRAASR